MRGCCGVRVTRCRRRGRWGRCTTSLTSSTPRRANSCDSGDQPYDIFGAVFDELRAQPTVLVVDDLHWADQGTIDLYRFLLRRARQTPLLMIGIARDDEVERHASAAGAAR